MGLRVVMYGCGLVGACVYLANLNEVRALTASVHNLEDGLAESERTEDWDASQDRAALNGKIDRSRNARLHMQASGDSVGGAG